MRRRIVHQKLERAAPALIKPYPEWLSEDYFIFHVREIAGSPSASDLCTSQGGRIAQIVRGETAQLSEGERNEILQSRISYYPNDLAVIGWNAAFHLRQRNRRRDGDPAAGVRQLAVAGIPPLRRTADPRTGESCTPASTKAQECWLAGAWPGPRPSCTPSCST